MSRTQREIQGTRRRCEERRVAGQELTPKGLPEPTALDGAPASPDAVIHRVPGAARRARDDAPYQILDRPSRTSLSQAAARR